LRCGIAWSDELRDHVTSCAPSSSIQSRQLLLYRAAGPLWIAIPAPIMTCDRALLVGVGLNQARIDCKAFAANQTGCDASLDDALEHAAKNLSLTEALIVGTRKRRMIGDGVLDAKPA